ncbi:MAG: hypothetical protein M3T56_18240 [Chloroflexota bacterium]|nr:hypothetical protein [Chloroflexota bacterium]
MRARPHAAPAPTVGGTAVIAWTVYGVSLALVVIALLLLALSWSVAVPPGWGFRGFPAIFAVVYGSVGLVIAIRRPRNPIGWWLLVGALLSGVQVLAEEYAFYALLQRHGELPGGEFGAWVQSWIWLLPPSILAPVVLLFPDGRLRSRRWRVVAAIGVPAFAFNAMLYALTPGVMNGLAAIIDNPYGLDALARPAGILTALGYVGMFAFTVAISISVFLRFREARGTERQQLKWFAYAIGVAAFAIFLNFLVLGVATVTVSREAAVLMSAHPAVKAAQAFNVSGLSFVPVAIGIAIVRYRLYDIDLLINRTVVYGATSAAIGATFFVGIVALQTALKPLTAGSELAIAASTLLSFALFQPIRQHVQIAVDRRFDRSRYDAARTLDAFADRLRDEVDLNALRTDLLGAVGETMAPAHAGLWLRERS